MGLHENLPKTGYTTTTAGNFLTNAGLWVKNFAYDSDEKKFKYDLIGATSGGSKITIKYNYRQVEVDGVFVPVVGGDMIESAEGSAEINLIEFSPDTIKMLVLGDLRGAAADESVPDGYKVISPRGKVTTNDYIENLAYIGTLSGADEPVIIIFHHAICTSGLEFEPADKSEAKYTATFELRAGEGDYENMALPVTFWYPQVIVAEKVVLNKTALTLVEGATEMLIATATPADTTYKPVWLSSNNTVAKVEDGKVTAVSKGTAKISVMFGNVSASCDVTVSEE